MKKLIFIFVSFLFLSKISAQNENINSGKYNGAKQHFETLYQEQKYYQFSESQIQVDNNKVILNKLQSIIYPKDIDKKLKLIFESGLLEPMQIIKNPHLVISGIDELPLLNPNYQTKRFSFIVFKKELGIEDNDLTKTLIGKANPYIYYFEIQNKKADENTSFEDFVKDASLTYLGHGGIQL